jgi:hypothetical protein
MDSTGCSPDDSSPMRAMRTPPNSIEKKQIGTPLPVRSHSSFTMEARCW